MSRPSPPQWRRRLHGAFLRLPRKVRSRVVRVATPNYTVGSVVLLRDRDGGLLLLRQPPGHKGWSLPGGFLDRFEDPAAGALRELAEETGVRLHVDDLSPAQPNAVVHPRLQQVDCVFTATVDATVELDVDPVEVIEAQWFPVDSLPPLTAATARLLSSYGFGPWASARPSA